MLGAPPARVAGLLLVEALWLAVLATVLGLAAGHVLMEVVGPFALPYAPEEDRRNEPPVGPDWAASVAPTYFNWRKISIYGGSNEIQKNIIAKAILGF